MLGYFRFSQCGLTCNRQEICLEKVLLLHRRNQLSLSFCQNEAIKLKPDYATASIKAFPLPYKALA